MSGSPPQDTRPGGSQPPHPAFQEALDYLEALDAWVLERQVELSAIPAPPFGEGPRGERMAALLGSAGLVAVRSDAAGNVLAELPATLEDRLRAEPSPPLVLSAHLDTVFPPGTAVTPRRTGDVIRGPGICDDGRGLAGLLALARALVELPLSLPFPVLFAATVGEEGAGNLRGGRYLFREGGEARRARGFISLDGIGLERIIVRGVGSTRLRIGIRGPGGHSWTDWGLPNPIHVLGRVVAGAQDLSVPSSPRSTLTVARWGGGRSINAIPQEAWLEVDLRSEGAGALQALEQGLLEICARETECAGAAGGEEGRRLELEVEELGRRPSGSTDPSHPLVGAAMQATRAVGVDPQLAASSTDANVPMALGIPALTLGVGGVGGGIHTLEEWYRNEGGSKGVLRALLTLLLLG